MYTIRIYGDPVLRVKGMKVPVEKIPEIKDIAEEMFRAMYAHEGIGLAAQQVGITEQIVVIDTHEEGSSPMVIINPDILAYSEEESSYEEGCLSFPDIRADIRRPVAIKLSYYDIHGNEHTEEFDGLLARVLQHEIDHINGTLFIDRMSPVSRMLLKKKLNKLKESHGDTP
ncbi:MAG: peptide deformylase [Candidatus Auribacterota bacterium]